MISRPKFYNAVIDRYLESGIGRGEPVNQGPANDCKIAHDFVKLFTTL